LAAGVVPRPGSKARDEMARRVKQHRCAEHPASGGVQLLVGNERFLMPTGQPTPPPRGAGKFAVVAAVIVGMIIIVTFVGMNIHHAQTAREQETGQVRPADAPMTEKDLGKLPASPK
jgi:hypothetical protein